MMQHLQGKTALITGGGSGVGLATARLFLKEGAVVAIAGRDGEKLKRAAAELKGVDNLITHAADVADAKQSAEMVRAVTAKFGRIDVLVANAGMNIKNRSIRELNPET